MSRGTSLHHKFWGELDYDVRVTRVPRVVNRTARVISLVFKLTIGAYSQERTP